MNIAAGVLFGSDFLMPIVFFLSGVISLIVAILLERGKK
jgi:hypothetical protein